jgi:hypothetical protein
VNGQLHARERNSGTHWIGWVGPRAGLDDMKKLKFLTLPELELLSDMFTFFAIIWKSDDTGSSYKYLSKHLFCFPVHIFLFCR